MTDRKDARVAKWPFLVGDVLLLGTAYVILSRNEIPLSIGQSVLIALCVLAGAILAVVPFAMEYRAAADLEKFGKVEEAIGRLGQVEKVAAQISATTQQLDQAQEEAATTVKAAKDISDRMSAEIKGFADFIQKANDTEKANLRLETEKLRRTEAEWLQGTVRILDHIYALYVAAMRSGQRNVIEQVSNFQGACIDTTRRMGLAPFVAKPGERFDSGRHQPLDGTAPPPDSVVEATMAAGYNFQGRVLRPALVKVSSGGAPAATAETTETSKPAQSDLPLPGQ